MLAGINLSLERLAPGRVELTAFSADPAETTGSHHLAAVQRMNWKEVGRALASSDALIVGGGSLLQDTTSLRSLIYYIGVMRWARWKRKPVILYSQGIGPLRRQIARRLTRIEAERAALVTVRDRNSAALLESIGVKQPITLSADPAFMLEADRLGGSASRDKKSCEKPLIGLALRNWDEPTRTENRYRQLIEAIKEIGSPLLIPMQRPDDQVLCNDLATKTGSLALEPIVSPTEMMAVLGSLDVLIGVRLHALIFALTAGTPVLAIGYDPKVDALMEELGKSDFLISWQNWSADLVTEKIGKLLSTNEAARVAQQQGIQMMRNRSLIAARLTLGVLGINIDTDAQSATMGAGNH